MPNKVKRDKTSRRGSRHAPRPLAPAVHSVKTLLERRTPVFSESFAQQARQAQWRARLEATLPDSLATRISGIVERPAQLVIYAESAVWAARLRYCVAEHEGVLRADRPEITSIVVRVLPRRNG